MNWDLVFLLDSVFSGDEDFDKSAVSLAEGVVELYKEMDWTIDGYTEPEDTE